MVESFVETRSATTELLVYLDEADPQALDYAILWAEYPFQLEFGPFRWLCEAVNFITANHAADYYCIINDDHVFRTANWDQRLIGAIQANGGWGYAYGRTENLPTAAVVSANLIHALGHYFPEGLKHQFADNYERDLFEAAGVAIPVPDVFIEHLHPAFGKAPNDATYERVRPIFAEDQARYHHWRAHEMAADVAKIRAARGL